MGALSLVSMATPPVCCSLHGSSSEGSCCTGYSFRAWMKGLKQVLKSCLQVDDPNTSNAGLLVKELNLSYHNTDIYQMIWFLDFGNLL